MFINHASKNIHNHSVIYFKDRLFVVVYVLATSKVISGRSQVGTRPDVTVDVART